MLCKQVSKVFNSYTQLQSEGKVSINVKAKRGIKYNYRLKWPCSDLKVIFRTAITGTIMKRHDLLLWLYKSISV